MIPREIKRVQYYIGILLLDNMTGRRGGEPSDLTMLGLIRAVTSITPSLS